jgi:methanogenic corrinoid protein MtbC1
VKERDDYVVALQDADARAATAAMQTALRRGATPAEWIHDVVVPTQREVGELWFDGTWSIADEHAATAVAEQTVTLLQPLNEPETDALTVVFACAEGEWHTFPARLAAELLAGTGARSVFLGASVPADHLSRRLEASQPDVLALSCTMPTNLIGAWRSIRAAHELGVPVAVGGRAWGLDDVRAGALGADRRLDDVVELARSRIEGVAAAVELPLEALQLDVPDSDVLLLALDRQVAATPWMQTMSDYRRRATLDDLAWLARHAAAAVATSDPRILHELLDWLVALLTPRGVPAAAVIDSCYYLADAVEPTAPLAAGLLRTEADAARARHCA